MGRNFQNVYRSDVHRASADHSAHGGSVAFADHPVSESAKVDSHLFRNCLYWEFAIHGFAGWYDIGECEDHYFGAAFFCGGYSGGKGETYSKKKKNQLKIANFLIMNFRFTIYDLFAHTIPGIINLGVVYYLLNILGYYKYGLTDLFNELTFTQIIILLIIGYVISTIVDRVSADFWYFRVSGNQDDSMFETSYNNIFERYNHFKFYFKKEDWPILLSEITSISSDCAQNINKFNVLYIMLRNTSFSLYFLFLIECVNILVNGFTFERLALLILIFLLSVIAVRRAYRMEKYFYNNIFETSLALKLRTLEVPEKPPVSE